jgi:hypothetical protein
VNWLPVPSSITLMGIGDGFLAGKQDDGKYEMRTGLISKLISGHPPVGSCSRENLVLLVILFLITVTVSVVLSGLMSKGRPF